MHWGTEFRALRNALHPTHNAWLRKLSGIARYLPDLIAASLVINLLGLALPLTLLQVYDRILPNSSTDTLTALVIGVVLTQTLEVVLRIARSSITAWTSARFEHTALNRAFNTLLRQPVDEFERKGTGAHNETIGSINSLKEFYSGQAFLSVFDIPFAVLYLLLMAAFGGWMVMIPITLIAAFSVAAVVMGKKIREAMDKRIFSDDSRVNFLVEILSGIGTIKSLAMEEQMRRRYERLLENSAQAEFHAGELSNKAGALSMLFSHLTTILVVSFGSVMVIKSGMSTGVLAACSLLAGRCVQPMQAALDRWTRFQAASLAEQRLTALLRNETHESRPEFPRIEGKVILQDVELAFEEGQPILRDVVLEAQAGEMIGISGENGSGKSSLLGLISGSITPSKGVVRIDDHDLRDFDPESIRRQVAYIPQRPELFRGTILENLTLFDPTHREEAKDVSRRLGIDRMVARMPLGYDTIVGEGASDTLPRGIRQLIVIAQALVHKPRVILFDDANSAVDGAGDQLLRAHLESLKGSCTIILITSRPSLLNLSTRQYKLVDGRLLDTSKVTNLPNGAAPRDPVTSLPPGTPVPPRPAEPTQDVQAVAAHTAHDIAHALHDAPAAHTNGRGSTDFLREIENGSPLGRCLLPLLESMEWQGNLRNLAEALPHFQNKLDIVAFRNVLASLGFNSSSESMQGADLDARLLPCLFMTQTDEPIILTRMDQNHIIHGYNGQTREEVVLPSQKMWGSIYLFAEEEAAAAAPQPGQWFKKVLSRFYGLIWAVLGQSLIINLLALGMPFFTMSVYDKVIASGDVAMLVSFLVGVMIVIASDEVLREIRYQATSYIGTRIGYIVASTVFERTLKLPLAFTERASIGSQLARFKDLESFRDFFTGGVAGMLLDLPFVIIYLVVLINFGGVIAFVPLVALGVFALILSGMMPQIRKRVAASGRASTRRNEFMVETLLKMRALHAASLEPVWRNRFREYAAASAMGSSQSATVTGALATISQSLVILSGLSTMAVGVEQVLNNNMTAGALIGSMMVVWRVLAPIQTGFSLMTRVEQTRSSIRQLENLVSIKTEGEGLSVKSNSDMQLRGAISFNRVSLRYSNDTDPALLGVSFDAKPGEVICVLGPDGAGKSTLLKVLAGLYPPQAGNVTIDDLDIRQLDPIALRKAIGYAPQVPQMFFGTIAQNLRLAHPTASDADLRWAMEAVGAWDEIKSLPQGLNTRVGDSRSNRMSPSLAQSISLARAYLKHSSILLLDEPVTGLDFEGDRHFRNFIESMRGKATILIVTHRPSHFNLADQILVMERGAIRLAGPAEEVKAKLAGR